MASVRRLKKNVASVLGELVDTTIIWNFIRENNDEASESIVQDIYEVYDNFLLKINNPTENKGAFYKQLQKDFEKEVNRIVAKINDLK
jgi:hypothetical protein